MLIFAPVMYELRCETRNATNGPTSSGRPARGICDGCPKCVPIASIRAYGSVDSTPTDLAHSLSDGVTIVPGETTLTRISSGASSCDRFFDALVNIAFAAV